MQNLGYLARGSLLRRQILALPRRHLAVIFTTWPDERNKHFWHVEFGWNPSLDRIRTVRMSIRIIARPGWTLNTGAQCCDSRVNPQHRRSDVR